MNNFFIKRTFKDIITKNIIDFDTVINNNLISVILGEPASGKTYQFKKYNTKQSKIIELMLIDDEDDVKDDIEVLLIDSIDETTAQ
jgi:hypothetical protein